MVGVSHEHTSVPRWPSARAGIDPSGTSYLILSAGAAGAEVAEDWISEVQHSGRPLWSHLEAPSGSAVPAAASGAPSTAGAHCAAALAEALADARVGARIMLAGPELFVLDCAAAARSAGAIDAEITAWVSDADVKRVHCPHCQALTVAEVAVAETVRCGGCERELLVYHHVSRARGAYLGFQVDAEAVPA